MKRGLIALASAVLLISGCSSGGDDAIKTVTVTAGASGVSPVDESTRF